MRKWRRPWQPRRRREPTACERCGAKETLYIRVDGNNAAITAASPHLCRACYVSRYPDEAGHPNAQDTPNA